MGPTDAMNASSVRGLEHTFKRYRLTEGGANLFLRAAGPAFVVARVVSLDGEIVPRLVAVDPCAGRTLRPIIAAVLPARPDMFEDVELIPNLVGSRCRSWLIHHGRRWLVGLRQPHPLNEGLQLVFGEFRNLE